MSASTDNVGLVIGAGIYLTEPPASIDPAIAMYLNQLRTQLQEHVRQNFANMQLVAGAINSGTNPPSTFVISSGSKLTIVNGIITSAS